MKRVLLFVATNLAILVVLSIAARLLGLDAWLGARGGNLGGLLAFAALFGFGGAFLSLAMAKVMAKRAMGVHTIGQPANEAERWLLETVRAQAAAAGVGMPEVGIFDSPAPNAFATGMRRDAALVAVSTGLLQSMSRDEVQAVLAHEVSHVANGDMVTLALIQGVVNTFVIFHARIIGSVVASLARLAGTGSMIGALERLKAAQNEPLPASQLAAFGINGGVARGLGRLFMTHPPLDERIAALRALASG